MESFVTTVALIGIVIVIASLLSGVIERTGLPLVPIFLLLGVALGPWGLGITDVGFHSPALHALAMLGLALLLFSDAVTIDTKQLRVRRFMLWRLLGPGTLVPAVLTALAAWLLLDRSRSMVFGAEGRSKDVVLVELAVTLARLLAGGGNRVGALLFDEKVEKVVPARSGRTHVLRLVHELGKRPPITAPTGEPTPPSSAMVRKTMDSAKENWSGLIYVKLPANRPPPRPACPRQSSSRASASLRLRPVT